MPVNEDDIDEALGITRCVRCGQKLEGEIECPFCSLFPEKPLNSVLPKWIFITACFMTSRGCPYNCSFCSASAMFGKTYTMRSAKNIVDEIEIKVRELVNSL